MNALFIPQYILQQSIPILKSIPSYLHNRSRSFVLNSLEKRGNALWSGLTEITEKYPFPFQVFQVTCINHLGQSIQEWTKWNLWKKPFNKFEVWNFLKAVFYKFYLGPLFNTLSHLKYMLKTKMKWQNVVVLMGENLAICVSTSFQCLKSIHHGRLIFISTLQK